MSYIRLIKVFAVLPCVRPMASEGELRLLLTTICSTVILLLLMVKKSMSNQWPSDCSVNNSDEMGRCVGGSAAE